jgi:transposase
MLVTVHYRPDLTATQWHLIKKGIPPQKKGLKQVCRRCILNTIHSLVRTGCQWRNLPHCFPKWTLYYLP